MNALTFPKREPKRSRVFLSADVDAGNGPVAVRIRDISRTGALLESDLPPKGGDSVRMTCGSTVAEGRVAWSDRGWFGVEFDSPLVVDDLVDSTGVKLNVSAPRAYRSADPLD
jgi:hypothetical protein